MGQLGDRMRDRPRLHGIGKSGILKQKVVLQPQRPFRRQEAGAEIAE
jgi:hypothetical protein